MKPNIVFVIMSAVHSPDVVSQLARALAPHTVLIHHDFSQTPDFKVDATNVRFVPDPKRTGWDAWGFTEGIIHSLQYAVDNIPFDYIQILSPTCLPIKPLAEFERYVASNRAEANFSSVSLLDNEDVLMTVGYRALAARGTLKHRILRRLTLIYFGGSTARVDVAGVQLRAFEGSKPRGELGIISRIARAVLRQAARGSMGWHPFTETFRPYYGSTWFGARRHVIVSLLERFHQPDVQRHFPSLVIADEFLFPTLLKNAGVRSEETNHYIATFREANPIWLGEAEFEGIRDNHRFFGRKFPDDANASVRLRVLTELVGRPDAVSSTAHSGTVDRMLVRS